MVELLKIITYFYKTLEIMIESYSMKKMNHPMGTISKKLLFRDKKVIKNKLKEII